MGLFLVGLELCPPTSVASIVLACNSIVRKVQDNLGATPVMGIHAFCSPEFYDDLVTNQYVRATYDRWMGVNLMTQQIGGFLREGHVRQMPFHWNGIDWEEYRGALGATSSRVPAPRVEVRALLPAESEEGPCLHRTTQTIPLGACGVSCSATTDASRMTRTTARSARGACWTSCSTTRSSRTMTTN